MRHPWTAVSLADDKVGFQVSVHAVTAAPKPTLYVEGLKDTEAARKVIESTLNGVKGVRGVMVDTGLAEVFVFVEYDADAMKPHDLASRSRPPGARRGQRARERGQKVVHGRRGQPPGQLLHLPWRGRQGAGALRAWRVWPPTAQTPVSERGAIEGCARRVARWAAPALLTFLPMLQRTPPPTSPVDVLDRVLDKGIVIEARLRVSLVGVDLVQLEACVVVASIASYVPHSPALGRVERVATPGGVPQCRPHRAVRRAEPVTLTCRRSSVPAGWRSAGRLFRCPSGCTFRLDGTARSVQTTIQIACPYHARTTCSIRLIPIA